MSTASQLAAIRAQITKISSMASSGNLSAAQKASALSSIQSAQTQLSSIKSSSSGSSASTTTTKTPTQQLADIRKQIETIQKQAASGNLTAAQKASALQAIQAAQAQLQKIKQSLPVEEREELEKEVFDLEKIAEDVRLPRVEVTIDGVKYNLPKELVEGSHFKNADEMTKSLIAYTWGAIADQGHDIKKVINALDIAAQQSDVYIKQQVRMFEDELSNSFGYIIEDYGVGKEVTLRQMDYTTADLEATERLITRRTAELKEDLEYHSGNLEIDRQNELTKQLKNYELRVEDTRGQLADAGLSFSSIRGRSEKLLEEAHKDIVEDIETKVARQQKEMKISAERGEADLLLKQQEAQKQASRQQQSLQDQLNQLQTNTGRGLTGLLRQGEKFLGTDAMKKMLGQLGPLPSSMGSFELLGGINATGLKEMQYSDILSRATGLLGTR